MIRTVAIIAAVLVVASLAPGFAAAQDAAGVTFNEQASGGRSVLVESVTLPEGGFVAIHDSTLVSEEDALGSVVGVSAFLAPGTYENVRVTLSRSLADPKDTLIAMPHKDSNGNGLYDFVSSNGADDGPYAGGPNAVDTFAGKIVIAAANVNLSATVEVAPQVTSGRGMIVDYVDLAKGGFIAVHDATLLDGEVLTSVAGVSAYLEAGAHRNVQVTFTREVAEGPYIPMAHLDTNDNDVYDFVTSNGTDDGPYTGATGTPQGIVLQPVEVTYSQDANVTFSEQAFGGNLVMVDEAFLPEGGFVAIHDSTLVSAEDALGSVVGVSANLSAGLHRNIPVQLGEAFTNASDTFIAMPHLDSNGNGVYDFVSSQGADDGPYVGGANAVETFAGALVISAKNVTLTASAVIAPSDAKDGVVTIPFADFSEAGFVALHDASLLADLGANVLTSVIGVSAALEPGLHENVTVTLDSPIAFSTTVIAMPHQDTNANGVYDFVTSNGTEDGPFLGGMGPGGISIAVAEIANAEADARTPQFVAYPALGEKFSATPPTEEPPMVTPPTPTPATPTPPTDDGDTVEENRDTPGPALAATLAVLGVLAFLYARRRR